MITSQMVFLMIFDYQNIGLDTLFIQLSALLAAI